MNKKMNGRARKRKESDINEHPLMHENHKNATFLQRHIKWMNRLTFVHFIGNDILSPVGVAKADVQAI